MNLIFSDQPVKVSEKMIFLAGPTSRTNDFDKSWRKEMAALFEQAGFDGTICIPEFSEKRPFTDADWQNQVNWEWTLLDNAACILFWIPRHLPDMPGFTTNLEFGTWLHRSPQKVVLAYPPDAEKMEWLKIRYEYMTGKQPVYTMEDAVSEAIKIASKI